MDAESWPGTSSERVFRYGLSRASWTMLALFFGALALMAVPYVVLGVAPLTDEVVMGLGAIALVLALILLAVPVMEMGWVVRGRVVVGDDALRWCGLGGWIEIEWAEVIAVGRPPADAGRSEDERIHVLTADDYHFVHGFGLRGREEALDLVVSRADLSERRQVGRHLFMCRAGTGDEVEQRAGGHVNPDDDDMLDFWARRFRRF